MYDLKRLSFLYVLLRKMVVLKLTCCCACAFMYIPLKAPSMMSRNVPSFVCDFSY